MSLRSIRLLIIEDRPDDAELVIDEFECAGYTVHSNRVASADSLRKALEESWDLILSDHAMPSFNSRSALKIVRQAEIDIPFILVSGSIGEREAVEMMRLGVSDYIIKDNLDRLVVSAERELREAENRRKRREAERELRENEKRLQALYVQADKLNRLKDDFLATLSHELRTPLNVIMGNAEMLVDVAKESGSEEILQMADAIHRNSILQTQLVDDLLDISSIITGKIRCEPTELDPRPVLEKVVETLMPTAVAKGIRLDLDMEGIPATVRADSSRLRQILWNLLSNALKFTPENGCVRIKAGGTDKTAFFEFRDNGIGIEPDFLPAIFERFHQEDNSITRRYGGLGLGLSIVRNLIELQGGTVEAHSDGKGRGAAFVVSLPRAQATQSPGQQSRGQPYETPNQVDQERPLQGIKVLLIEDSTDARELELRFLTRVGAEVWEAGSAAQARSILEGCRPDVIVSDIGLSAEDGMEFMRSLRRSGRLDRRHIPAIALTAYAREEDREGALAAGFQMHVVKPVSRLLLLEAILKVLA